MAAELEEQIGQWRGYLLRRQAIAAVDVAELEDHLREQVAVLSDAGLTGDEAFLVAVKRLGDLDGLSREFAREHSDRLWKQLVVAPAEPGERRAALRSDAVVAFACAAGAALLVKLPALLGVSLDEDGDVYARNVGLLVLPVLACYFAWKRGLGLAGLRWPAVSFAVAAVLVNVFPWAADGSSTEALAALHLPVVLALVVGAVYAGRRWREPGGRMDFVRFAGELLIYYVLMALGGGVLTGLVAVLFDAIGVDAGPFIQGWLLPCGAAAALIVASWLVEAKQSVVENMAPVLTRLFTPLFAAVLVGFLVALLWTGHGVDVERDLLIQFNALLLVVLGLHLYSLSARDAAAPRSTFDVLQVVLVASALLADAVALWAIASRIGDLGFTPNRVAALGLNLVLLGNLSWSAVLYVRFLRGGGPFARLERWQTAYLPVYAAWAAAVVVVLPPAFGYA